MCLSTHSHVPGENGKQRLLSQLHRELSVTPTFLVSWVITLSLSLSHTKVQGANASRGLARTIKLKWTKKMGV